MATLRKILALVTLSALVLLAQGCGLHHYAGGEEWETISQDGKWWTFSSWHATRGFFDRLSAVVGYDMLRAGVGFSCETVGDHKEEVFVYFSDEPNTGLMKVHWGDGTPQVESFGEIPSPWRHPSGWPYTYGWPATQPALKNLLANDKVTVEVPHTMTYGHMNYDYSITRHRYTYDASFQFDISGATAAIEQARAKCRG